MYDANYMKNIPNFREGLTRVLDMGSRVNKRKFQISDDDVEKDQEFLAADWVIVGDDIRRAINEFGSTGRTGSRR